MQIARVRVQGAGLTADRVDDTGVAVPDMWDIVVAIQIFAPISVPQPNTASFDEMDWVVIKCRDIWTHQAGAVRN